MSAILNICLLAGLCLVCEIRSGRSYSDNYNRLCETISQKAANQRLKLCGENRNRLREFRVKRAVNTTQRSTLALKQTTTTKRPLSSYRCDKLYPTSKNGFKLVGNGLKWTAKCPEDKNSVAADITWEKPKPEPGKDDCIGYFLMWETTFGLFCDHITDGNTTTYFIDASKGLGNKEKMSIVVLPLPQSAMGNVGRRPFQPPSCSDNTHTFNNTHTTPGTNTTKYTYEPPFNKTHTKPGMIPTKTSHGISKENSTKSQTDLAKTTYAATGNETVIPRPGQDKDVSNKPVVNKMVFSIVITCIAVAIVALLVLFYKRKPSVKKVIRAREIHEGAPHYISYHDENKSEAKGIADWLLSKKINVVIDIFFTKTNPQAWSEERLLEAEKIIMVITSEYLKVCNLYHSENNKEEKLSFNDQLCRNEISLIRNKLIMRENLLASEKFIGILIGIKKNDLPHWMSQLNCYKYKNGEFDDEEILGKLKPCTYYNRGVIESN